MSATPLTVQRKPGTKALPASPKANNVGESINDGVHKVPFTSTSVCSSKFRSDLLAVWAHRGLDIFLKAVGNRVGSPSGRKGGVGMAVSETTRFLSAAALLLPSYYKCSC